MKKIKVLYIIGSIGIGGCEKQLLEFCRRANSERFDLSLIWYSHSSDEMKKEFIEADVKTIFFDKFSMPLAKFLLIMRNSVKKIHPDIVHTWLYSANFWGRWAAVACSVPHIVCSYRDEKTNSNHIERLTEKLLSKRTIRLVNSNTVAQSLVKTFRIPLEQIKIINNGIAFKQEDISRARAEVRKEFGLKENEKIILMVASQQPVKNYPLFIRAAHKVCSKMPGVTFIGVGRDDLKDELNILIEKLDIKGKVILTGQRTDVLRMTASADIYCFTSNSEGFPNAILEAMMTGLPVITTDFPAAREIIKNRENGIIVPINDDYTMAEEVLQLLNDYEHAQRLGAQAKATVRQRYSVDSMVQKIEQLYVELINR